GENLVQNSASSACSALNVVAARRCRQPVPARVAADANGQPVRVTTDRRGFAGGSVVRATGPWKTSGEWWLQEAGGAGEAGRAGGEGGLGGGRRGGGRGGRAAYPGVPAL